MERCLKPELGNHFSNT
ncbi:hypothetical protein D046_6581A, partial [Vibrio parahaemolyticus V-223/04]